MYDRVLRPIFEFVTWAEAGGMGRDAEEIDATLNMFQANVMPNMTREQRTILRQRLNAAYPQVSTWPLPERRRHMMLTLRGFASPWL